MQFAATDKQVVSGKLRDVRGLVHDCRLRTGCPRYSRLHDLQKAREFLPVDWQETFGPSAICNLVGRNIDAVEFWRRFPRRVRVRRILRDSETGQAGQR